MMAMVRRALALALLFAQPAAMAQLAAQAQPPVQAPLPPQAPPPALARPAAPAAQAAVAGPALQRALHGVWCNSQDGGRSCWAYDEFRADGSFRACGRAEGDRRPFHGAGQFTVSGQRMCYLVAEASENFWLPPGSRYCTEIVAIDRRTHRYRDLDSGAEFTLYRRAAAQTHCPS